MTHIKFPWLGLICFTAFLGLQGHAATFTVTTNADAGAGSLREAISSVNNSSDPANTITINPAIGTIALASSLPLIVKPVDIVGNAAVVDGQTLYRSFAFQTTGSASIDSVTIANCIAKGGNGGIGYDGATSGGGGGGGGGGGFGGGSVCLSSVDFNGVIFSSNQAIGGNGGVTNGIAGGGLPGGAGGGGMLESGANGTDSTGGVGGDGLAGTGSGASGAGAGSFGGGGGGGSEASGKTGGGSGGFGGGGGGGQYGNFGNGRGGSGGFGGGGGGAHSNGGGSAGFGGGGGTLGAGLTGGGGAGLGGALFVQSGQSVTLVNPTFSANSVTGGTGTNSGSGFGEDIFMMSGSNLTLNLSSDLTMPSAIESDQGAGGGTGGGLIKAGSAVLTLVGSNTYTSATTIDAGTLRAGAANTLPSTTAITLANVTGATLDLNGFANIVGSLAGGGTTGGNITLGSGALTVGDAGSTTYSGAISGSGALTKQGSGTLTLDGANTYSGGTTVSGGTLQGPSTSLQGNILNNAIVNFQQATSGTYAGSMTGTGTINKTGAGQLTVTGDSSLFAGIVNVQAGNLKVMSNLAGQFTVFPSAELGGTGTVGSITNQGAVSPGASIGTLTVSGNYTQASTGTLLVEIDSSGNADLLNVSGTAALDGALSVIVSPGVYAPDTVYTILTAGGGVSGVFSSAVDTYPSLAFTVSYLSNAVELFTPGGGALVPPVLNPPGNAGKVSDYFVCQAFPFDNADLLAVVEALFALEPDAYVKALNRLTPAQFGAFPLAELESNFNLGNTFFVAGTGQRSHCYIGEKNPMSIWVNPLGFMYSQKGRQQASGFDNHTYGVATGVDRLIASHWTVGLGGGYSHSHLHWDNQEGKSNVDSGYLGPYVKYDSKHIYFDFLLLGAGNFYNVDRKIKFPGLSRTASSDPTTWNLSEILLVGGRIKPFRNVDQLFFQPELMLDQLNSFQGRFHEKGAHSIDLTVKSKYASFLRSLLNAKFVKEWHVSNFCLIPSLNVGWLRTTPLNGGNYTARFKGLKICESDFTVQSFHETIDQLLVGAQFLASREGRLDFSVGYQGEFGEGTKVNEINAAFRWRF